MSGTLRNWDETALWNAIQTSEGPELEDIRAALRVALSKIQAVLASGGSSPADFTLHDAQHSFRVAQRMAEIVPSDVMRELSIYELSLLLLSAYLHDIGMSPPRDMLNGLVEFALTGQSAKLSASDTATFQDWLDVTGWTAESAPSLQWKDVERANLAVAHYVRSRHVEWGERWIDGNLRDFRLGTYAQSLDDLKLLCSSHHFDYGALLSSALDPKPVSSTGSIVHLRYLSTVLRVADVIEIDPERTPDVIFRHRDISPGSIIYWHKDHQISTLIQESRLALSAEPRDARIHRAIELTVNNIEAELEVARRLADERPFHSSSFQGKALPHRWDLQGHARVLIRPRADSYEYIDGAFRPNTEKLLHLLSGRNLYGDPLVAFREVLQNAFDAVREQIAYERLQRRDPGDEKWEQIFGETHEIDLDMRQDKEGAWWFVCADDGVGMNKTIIRDYLLVSGNTLNPRLRRLERDCDVAGIPFFRSGQFGIGVLSYFLVADLAIISTRRSPLPGDAESHGWRFESEGVGSFGELRRDDSIGSGTTVRLRLRPDVVNALTARDVADGAQGHGQVLPPRRFPAIVRDYVENVVLHAPCKVVLPREEEESRRHLSRGWSRSSADVCGIDRIVSYLREGARQEPGLVSQAQRSKLGERREYDRRLAVRLVNDCQWRVVEGELASAFGWFRAHIALFANADGLAPLLHEPHLTSELLSEPNREFVGIARVLDVSWKGIRVKVEGDALKRLYDGTHFFLLELDIRGSGAGTISVDRHSAVVTDAMIRAVAEVVDQVAVWLAEFGQKVEVSSYASLFMTPKGLAAFHDQVGAQTEWWIRVPVDGVDKPSLWGPTAYPMVTAEPGGFQSKEDDLWRGGWAGRLGGRPVTFLKRHLFWRTLGPTGSGTATVAWPWSKYPPDRVVGVRWNGVGRVGMTGVYSERPRLRLAFLGGGLAQFPREWSEVVLAEVGGLWLWNVGHPLVSIWERKPNERDGRVLSALKGESLEKESLADAITADLEKHYQLLLEERDLAAMWLSLAVMRLRDDEWIALAERGKSVLEEIWCGLLGSVESRLIVLSDQTKDLAVYVRQPLFPLYVRVVTARSAEVVREDAVGWRLATPCSESLLEIATVDRSLA